MPERIYCVRRRDGLKVLPKTCENTLPRWKLPEVEVPLFRGRKLRLLSPFPSICHSSGDLVSRSYVFRERPRSATKYDAAQPWYLAKAAIKSAACADVFNCWCCCARDLLPLQRWPNPYGVEWYSTSPNGGVRRFWCDTVFAL